MNGQIPVREPLIELEPDEVVTEHAAISVEGHVLEVRNRDLYLEISGEGALE